MPDFDLAELRAFHEREPYQLKRIEPADDAEMYETISLTGAEWKELRDAAEREGVHIPAMIRRLIAEGLMRRER